MRGAIEVTLAAEILPGRTIVIADDTIGGAARAASWTSWEKLASSRPAYIFFTSGTTGRPKAILGRADALAHFLQWEIDAFGLDQSLRVAQVTPPGHDPVLRDLLVPLAVGGTI